MTNRDNVVTTYLSDTEKARLTEMVEETESSQAEVLRQALLEFTDHDRAARIEERLDRIEEAIQGGRDEQTTHTHKDHVSTSTEPVTKSSSATEKARLMVQRIQDNHAEVMKDEDVERAIEDIAGVDDRTIRKYKKLFRRRGLLFENPNEPPTWTTDYEQWVKWLKLFYEANGEDAAADVADEYPVDFQKTVEGVRVERTEI